MIKYGISLIAALMIAVEVSADSDRVRTKVDPPIVMAGNSVRVTCTVPRNVENRFVTGMVDLYAYDTKPLNGTDSPVTFEFWFHKIPCDAVIVGCELQTSIGRTYVSTKVITVGGCGDGQ